MVIPTDGHTVRSEYRVEPSWLAAVIAPLLMIVICYPPFSAARLAAQDTPAAKTPPAAIQPATPPADPAKAAETTKHAEAAKTAEAAEAKKPAEPQEHAATAKTPEPKEAAEPAKTTETADQPKTDPNAAPGAEPSADPAADPGTEPAAKPVAATDQLAQEQGQLAEKYRRLEDLLFKMADFEATSNPRRAALLKQAYKQSKERLTYTQLNAIVKLLSDRQLKRAFDGQEVAQKDLEALLTLLLSENRSDRLKTEAQRIQEYIKELKRLERLQRSVRGRTEGGEDMNQLSKSQEKVAERTGDLAKKLEQDSAPAGQQNSDGQPSQSDGQSQPGAQKPPGEKPPGEKPSGDSPPGKKTPGKKTPGEKPPQDASGDQPAGKEPSDAEGSDSPPSKGKPSKSPPSKSQGQPPPGQEEGEPSEQSQDAEQQQQQQEDPAQRRVREAEHKMREAQQKLEEARRGESVEKQQEAEQKLKEAIAELEEILRQLREEEVGRMLALLEGRFRRMLEQQLKVYEGTIRLGKIPEDKRTQAVVIRANKLSFDERKIAADADHCLTLLLEEGSSIAFPEVVEQMRDDMEEVGARLAQTKVDRITQGLEEEIIATLEELIEALQKAQQELDQQRQQNQQSPPMQPGDMPLVDILSELKMIRSLQFRVNQRTQRYSRLLDDVEDPVGQAKEQDLQQALKKLADREQRIQQITRDIVLGKNQ